MKESPSEYIARMVAFAAGRDPMDVLAETPVRLADLLAQTSPDERRRIPAPGKWSINEITAHLADAEIVTACRIRMILAANGTPIQAYQQDVWARLFRYDQADALESARYMASVRASTLALLSRVDPTLLANHGVHTERGRETVSDILRFYAGHDINHLTQIERILIGAR